MRITVPRDSCGSGIALLSSTAERWKKHRYSMSTSFRWSPQDQGPEYVQAAPLACRPVVENHRHPYCKRPALFIPTG
jgi:hypothetical protein